MQQSNKPVFSNCKANMLQFLPLARVCKYGTVTRSNSFTLGTYTCSLIADPLNLSVEGLHSYKCWMMDAYYVLVAMLASYILLRLAT